jgi:hypothetical protein
MVTAAQVILRIHLAYAKKSAPKNQTSWIVMVTAAQAMLRIH